MSTRAMYTEDKPELQKQLGCMNGIFHLFDRRYLLGQRRHSHNQKKLTQGQSDDSKNKFNNAPEKHEDKIPNKAAKEKHRSSVESSRNSFSSSCSSTTFSSLDCSKRVQTEHSSFSQSVGSEPSSPTLQKQPGLPVQAPGIRDVVKDSMTRKPRVVSVKPVSKDERRGPVMTHVDSPRPLQNPKPVSCDRKDRNLVKLREISFGFRDVKETSRFSCDGRESAYKLKSIGNVKELPRLSLDSKQSSIKNRANESIEIEPGSNKRPSSGVVARLMGLEILDHESNSPSRLPIKGSESKLGNSITRIPLELAPWKQDNGNRGSRKTIKNKKASEPANQTGHSVYSEIEKRLTELEFKASDKDLRALKQILEAMQRTRTRLKPNRDSDHNIEPVSPIVKKPANLVTSTRKVRKVNHEDGREYPADKRSARNVTPKATGRPLSPRLLGSKTGIEKKPVRGSFSDPNRVRKQLNGLDSKSKNPKNKNVNDTSVVLETEPDITSTDSTRENDNCYRLDENHKKNVAERLIDYKPVAELAMLTIEQPSPVSVLDAFYTEDTPSPVKKKSCVFNGEDDLRFDEPEWNQLGFSNLISSPELDQSGSELNYMKNENTKNENTKHLVHQNELSNSGSDESIVEYITEILSSSGFLKNLDCATTIVHLHPTGSLINPELFHVLEKTKTSATSKSNEKIRRQTVFDAVNDILVRIISTSASKRKGRILNGENLLKELCSEISNLEAKTETGLYDEVINIISADMNRKSEDWDEHCNEVPVLVLDIERLIFKDLISEVVNDEITGLQDGPGSRCRQLFPM